MNYKINPEKKRGRQPRFNFTALETWSTLNGEVARNGHQYRVTFPRLNGEKSSLIGTISTIILFEISSAFTSMKRQRRLRAEHIVFGATYYKFLVNFYIVLVRET